MPRTLAYEPSNALNAICPYFTMFPLEYPLRVLKKHRRDTPVVMDPFCGRGTTLFAARLLGLASRGIDSSPVAVAIARAKLASLNMMDALDLARSYIDKGEPGTIPSSKFFRHAFAPTTLVNVCAIRNGLLNDKKETDASVLLRAAMLGCLHGPISKTPDHNSYLSNQMPRTFAPKPDYSVRYWMSTNLKAPVVDVIEVLRRKLQRIERSSPPEGAPSSSALLGDSRMVENLTADSLDFSVVVTSPPYYGMRTYVSDQWLRNWFLGGPDVVDYSCSTQLDHGGREVFAKSLGMVWKNMARTESDRLDMYVRFGVIPSSMVDPKALMMASLEDSGVRWRVASTRSARTSLSGKRQAQHMATKSTAALEFDFHLCRV